VVAAAAAAAAAAAVRNELGAAEEWDGMDAKVRLHNMGLNL
jgi:hypothetical protein